jgi:type II secretory pathway pseudopilin PulG
MRNSFTLLEILFAILIIAILSSVAVPKFMDSLDNANILKIRADISLIRVNIIEYKDNQLLKASNASYPPNLDTILNSLNISSEWIKNGTIYTIKVNSNNSVEFKYLNSTGIFDCIHKEQNLCQELTR